MSFRTTMALIVLAGVPGIAHSEPFAGSDLFIGRSVKPAAGARTFTAGLRMSGAPLDLAIGSTRERLIDEGVSEACGSNQTCRTETRQAVDQLSNLGDDEWARIEQAAGDQAALSRELQSLVAAGEISATDKQQIENFVSKNAATPEERQQTVALARHVAETRANILLTPYAEVNLDLLKVTAEMPLVLTLYENRTDLGLGNFNTDVRFGHHFDLGLAALGLSYGLHLYFPTGGDAAGPAAYAFLFHAPRYLKRYLSFAPYVVGGVDLPFLTVQAYGELVSMHRVRAGAGASNLQFFQYGVGLTLLPNFFVSVVGELNGMVPLNHAGDFNALFGLGGLQFRFFIVKVGVAVQAPIRSKTSGGTLPAIQGIPVNRLAKLSVLAYAGFEF